MTGHDILTQLEEHCGTKVTDRRLRFQITGAMDRLIKKNASMTQCIKEVLEGYDTYNPNTQKAIALSDREK